MKKMRSYTYSRVYSPLGVVIATVIFWGFVLICLAGFSDIPRTYNLLQACASGTAGCPMTAQVEE